MSEYTVGTSVKLKTNAIEGIITNKTYEVAWADKDGNPCKSYFSDVEIEPLNKTKGFGFSTKES